MISKAVTTKLSKSTFSHPFSKFLATAKVGLAHYDSFSGGGSHVCVYIELILWMCIIAYTDNRIMDWWHTVEYTCWCLLRCTCVLLYIRHVHALIYIHTLSLSLSLIHTHTHTLTLLCQIIETLSHKSIVTDFVINKKTQKNPSLFFSCICNVCKN